ncbi:MAG: histidine kinase [Bacteroidia bacterium]
MKSLSLYILVSMILCCLGGAEISYKLEKSEFVLVFLHTHKLPGQLYRLSSGEYYLLVKVRDKSGRISDKVLFKDKNTLHFYETVFLKLILFFVVVIPMVFIANFSARQKQRAAENKLKTERAINAERERISRDLHDSIGARLTKIISDLDIMELQAELNQQAVSAGELSKTRDYTQDTINNLRETI